MNIIGLCKECGAEVPLKTSEVADCIYECPECGHPHTLGEFYSLEDRADPTKTIGTAVKLPDPFVVPGILPTRQLQADSIKVAPILEQVMGLPEVKLADGPKVEETVNTDDFTSPECFRP